VKDSDRPYMDQDKGNDCPLGSFLTSDNTLDRDMMGEQESVKSSPFLFGSHPLLSALLHVQDLDLHIQAPMRDLYKGVHCIPFRHSRVQGL
jgi:hypothetical protein